MDDVLIMQVIQSHQNLSYDDGCFDIGKFPTLVLNVGEQIPCCDQVLEKETSYQGQTTQ